jgi:hypothetical protein
MNTEFIENHIEEFDAAVSALSVALSMPREDWNSKVAPILRRFRAALTEAYEAGKENGAKGVNYTSLINQGGKLLLDVTTAEALAQYRKELREKVEQYFAGQKVYHLVKNIKSDLLALLDTPKEKPKP